MSYKLTLELMDAREKQIQIKKEHTANIINNACSMQDQIDKAKALEKLLEINRLRYLANDVCYTIIKEQNESFSKDDKGPDGILADKNGKHINIEIRRKGFGNHTGKRCYLPGGWENSKLKKEGIYLNRETLLNSCDNGCIYMVEIWDCTAKKADLRRAFLTPERIADILKTEIVWVDSTNSGNSQKAHYIPLDLFDRFKDNIEENEFFEV